MNNITQCINGICEHPEHKINALWWIIPISIGIYLLYKGKALYRR